MSDQKLFGVYPAVVTDNRDPGVLGRVKIAVPEAAIGESPWATVVVPCVGHVEETTPAVGTEVVAAFVAGDPNRPLVLGAVWRGASAQVDGTSRDEVHDAGSGGVHTLALKSGHRLVIDESSQELRLLHSNGASVVLGSDGNIRVTANSTVEVVAPAVNVHAAIATFDGAVKCTALIASTVASASYTPGSGNLL